MIVVDHPTQNITCPNSMEHAAGEAGNGSSPEEAKGEAREGQLHRASSRYLTLIDRVASLCTLQRTDAVGSSDEEEDSAAASATAAHERRDGGMARRSLRSWIAGRLERSRKRSDEVREGGSVTRVWVFRKCGGTSYSSLLFIRQPGSHRCLILGTYANGAACDNPWVLNVMCWCVTLSSPLRRTLIANLTQLKAHFTSHNRHAYCSDICRGTPPAPHQVQYADTYNRHYCCRY